MAIFYTVSSKPLDAQIKPNLSLGGYQSSTPLKNGVLGGMFGDISMYTVKGNNQNQYIALMFKNDFGVNIDNIKVWFTFPDTCYSNMQIAVVDLASDEDGNQYMEQVRSYNEQPVYATFVDAISGSEADLGSMNSGEMVGIWVCRVLDLDTIKSDQSNIYVVDPTDSYRNISVSLLQEDDIVLNISYDVVV